MNTGAESKNMRLVGHHDLDGNGNGGEGLSLQKTRAGRRVLWIAHESAPTNFTGVDVTDPREPNVIVQTELPHRQVRSNSLDVVGDIMAVAFQTQQPGMQPAGVELFDVGEPARPRSIAFFDRSGEYSRGTHCLWFVDGEYLHISSGASDFQPHDQKDDQFYQILDVRDPSHPAEVGRWWLPGTRVGDAEAPPKRHTRIDSGFRTHNTNVYPERPDRAYVAYLDGGLVILDIADKSAPKLVGRLDYSPPTPGFTHTVLPLFSRELLVVSDESVRPAAEDWPKRTWIVDASEETSPMIVGSLPIPPPAEFAGRGGRYGAHNLHENHPIETAFRSDTLIFGAYFGGGVRVHDVTDAYQPVEVGYYVPEPPQGSIAGAPQINDVYVDENRTIYAIDRHAGGLYIMELTI